MDRGRDRWRVRTALAVAVLVGVGVVVGVTVWVSAGDDTGSSGSSSTETEGLRTLLVFEKDSKPAPSAPDGVMNGRLVKGKVPRGETVATVETDDDCAPDESGISHCLNKLRLKDGSQLEVRHPHSMHQVPCMLPGEQVNLKAA